MNVVDIVGGVKVSLNNQEKSLVDQFKAHFEQDKDVNFSELSDRLQRIAYDLYLRNVILIDDDGFIEMNEQQDTSECIRW